MWQSTKKYKVAVIPGKVARLVIAEDDVRLVVEQTAASEKDVRNALKESNYDSTAVILKLSESG